MRFLAPLHFEILKRFGNNISADSILRSHARFSLRHYVSLSNTHILPSATDCSMITPPLVYYGASHAVKISHINRRSLVSFNSTFTTFLDDTGDSPLIQLQRLLDKPVKTERDIENIIHFYQQLNNFEEVC